MNFSLEQSYNKIYNDKTKEYFKEVKSSYENGNYRSTIVSLYSVVVCDLIYKLQDLKDIFADSVAETILAEINEFQSRNSKSPEWEKKIIEAINDRTSILNASTYQNIKSLQMHRHLCAHPILEQNFELYKPNQETAISHIRNILEGLLVNPPLVTNKILNLILEDVAQNRSSLREDEELTKYLNARYFKYMISPVKAIVFRSIWKLVYFLDNKECNDNRSINARTLRIIYETDKDQFLQLISNDKEYYSRIKNGKTMFFLIGLIAFHPKILSVLTEDAKILIQSQDEDEEMTKAVAWFLSPSIDKHIDWLIKNDRKLSKITYSHIIPLRTPCIEAGKLNLFQKLLVKLYANTQDVDTWQYRYRILLYGMNEFSKETFDFLFAEIEKSNFLTNKSFGKINYTIMKKSLEKLDKQYDFSQYARYSKWLKEHNDIQH